MFNFNDQVSAGQNLNVPLIGSLLYSILARTHNAWGFSIHHNGKEHTNTCTLSMERNPFSAKNQTLRSYRVYISPTM